MQQFKIFTYSKHYQATENDVFVLSKGLNAGKPLPAPCPNCFVISCSSKPHANYFDVLCYGLHKAKFFHPLLTGSVIPFLRITDFKHVITSQANAISQNPTAFTEDVEKIKLMEQKEKQMRQLLKSIAELKRAMIYQHLKK
jgi:hypothetical protein